MFEDIEKYYYILIKSIVWHNEIIPCNTIVIMEHTTVYLWATQLSEFWFLGQQDEENAVGFSCASGSQRQEMWWVV